MAQEQFLNPPMPDIIEQWKFQLVQLNVQPNDIVLDIGCNSGDTEHLLVNLFPYIKKVIGLDHDKKRIAHAKQNWENQGKNEKIEFVQGDGLSLQFEDNSFDKVICAETVEWIKEPLIAINEIKRVLKPNGIALIQHTDWDQTVFMTKDIQKLRSIIQQFSDSGPDGNIGRKLYGMCHHVGFREVTPLVYTLINDKFEEPYYSYKVAHMMKDWLIEKQLMGEEELENWICELKEMSLQHEFFFSINRYLAICVK
ncbi:methyltransferase domain-containing protein [Metabacillus niabensis]|uniref:methyltransferase domain-containing protein n=1 Tax=Metabacillus niabensis TaxID=324854 RepID=UPI00399F9292